MSTRKLAIIAIVITLISLFTTMYTTVGQPAQVELEVNPSTGRGRYGETVTVSACGLRPGATVERIDFENKYTGQVYTYSVNVVVDETGCFTVDVVLGNMSYGIYDIIVYESPPLPPEPLTSSAIIPLNETGTVTVSAEEVGVNAVIRAEFSTLAYWGYRYYNYTTGSTGAVLGLLFTAEDGINYTIIAWLSDSTVYFRLLNAEGTQILNGTDVPLECENGVCIATWEFNIGEPQVPELYNNKAVFTYYPDTGEIRLDLYYGGRKLVIDKAMLSIIYENYDTGKIIAYYYEYPANLTFGDYGLEPITTDTWEDANISWTAKFEWNAITGEAVLTVYVEYLPREIRFESVYTVEPIIYLNGRPVESGTVLEWWTVYDYLIELYGFTPGELVIIEVNGNVIYYGFIDSDGNASYTFTVPLQLLDRGSWYTVRITGYYSNNVEVYEYVVDVLIAYPAIYVDYMLVEPGGTVNLGYLHPGRSIVIEARGFPPYTTLNLYLNDVFVAEFTTDEHGNFHQTLIASELPIVYGEQNILTIIGLYDEIEYIVHVIFTVPAIYVNNTLVMPDETVNLGYVSPEQQIRVEAKGFPPYTPITVWLDNKLVDVFETDETGVLVKVFTVRDLPISYGTANTLVIKAVYDETEYIAYATFTVPAIYVNNILVKPGETVDLGCACSTFPITVEAEGFPPYTPITLYVNGQLVGSFETDETGVFVGTFTVGELPFNYNATNTLTVLTVYNSIEYYAYIKFTIPGIYVDGTLVGFDEVYDAGVIIGVKTFTVEAFNLPLNAVVTIYLNDNYVGTYYVDERGYAQILLDAHKSMYPGEEGVYNITATYDGCIYKVQISFTIQEIYSYFKLVNPITGEPLTQPKASAGYNNGTIIVTLNGEPFDYLGDIIEVYIEGLWPGEKVTVKLVRGLLEFVIYEGVAREDGTLILEITMPSIPKGKYNVIAYLPERGYSILIPWSEDPEIKEFEIYPKIVVTRLNTYEVPVTVGIIAVRVFGSGFSENLGGFIVLLNGTDAIASVNSHTYAFWRTNERGLLLGPGGSQTGITIPVLEPGVYAITIYAATGDYTVGTGYILVANNLANVATKEDIESVANTLETVSANLYEILTRLDSIDATLSDVASNIMLLLDQQRYVLEILDELRNVVATKDDIVNVISYLELLEGRIDDLYSTIIALYEQLNVRIDDLEIYLATLIIQVESSILERTYELEDLMIYLYTLLQERIDELELALLSRLSEVESTLMQRIDEVELALTEKLSNLELLVEYVHTSLINRIDELEAYISSRLDTLEVWLEELSELVLYVHDSLYSRIEQLEVELSMAIDELESTLMTRIDELEASLTELIDIRTTYLEMLIMNVSDALATSLEELRELLYERTDYLALLIENVNATLNERIAEVEVFIDTRISDIELQLSELAALILDVHDSLQSRIDQLEETLTSAIIELEDSLSARIDELESSMIEYLDEKTEYIASLVENVNTTILAEIAELENSLDASITYLETLILNVNGTLTDLINARADYIESLVKDVNTTLVNMISDVKSLIEEKTAVLENLIKVVNETLSAEIAELETRMLLEFDSVKVMISGVNSTLTVRLEELELYVQELVDSSTKHLESRIADVNTTLNIELDRLESLINTISRELSGLINTTAEYIVDYISSEIETLESQVAANMTGLSDVLKQYIDERISELNESTTVAFKLYDERFEHVEEVLANITRSIEDLRSDVYTEVERVRTEIDVKYDEMSEKIEELDTKVDVAISTAEEARSLASTTMIISTVTLVLVIASLAIAVITLIKLRGVR